MHRTNGKIEIDNIREYLGDDFVLNVGDTISYTYQDAYVYSKTSKALLYLKMASETINDLGFELNKDINREVTIYEIESFILINISREFMIEYNRYLDDSYKIVINKSLISDKTNMDKIFLNCFYSYDIEIDETDSDISISIN